MRFERGLKYRNNCHVQHLFSNSRQNGQFLAEHIGEIGYSYIIIKMWF